MRRDNEVRELIAEYQRLRQAMSDERRQGYIDLNAKVAVLGEQMDRLGTAIDRLNERLFGDGNGDRGALGDIGNRLGDLERSRNFVMGGVWTIGTLWAIFQGLPTIAALLK